MRVIRLVRGPPGVCNDLSHFLNLSFGTCHLVSMNSFCEVQKTYVRMCPIASWQAIVMLVSGRSSSE